MNKILIVEDEPLMLRLYQNLFTQEGFDVSVVTTGKDCHQTAISYKPDVILLDVMMPEMNGFETLDVLKYDPLTKQLPVLILSNLSDKKYEEEALRRGAVRFITKSQIENKELVNVVRDIIGAYTVKPQ